MAVKLACITNVPSQRMNSFLWVELTSVQVVIIPKKYLAAKSVSTPWKNAVKLN